MPLLNETDRQYLNHLNRIVRQGTLKSNRTGTDTLSIFGAQMRFDLRNGFPLLNTKRIFHKGVIHELIWLISGDTNIKYMVDNGIGIWNEWADENGDLGPVYGHQWRKFGQTDRIEFNGETVAYGTEGVDQLQVAIDRLKTNPDCRRIIVSSWNPAEIHQMALAPCHMFFQFNTELIPGSDTKRFLDCHMYQRSADWFLGVPFNIASYALLTMMVAQVVGMTARHFIHSFGDTHLYVNHKEQALEQLSRPINEVLAQMTLNPAITSIDDFSFEDCVVSGYYPEDAISAEISV